jgi:hypothetical protein
MNAAAEGIIKRSAAEMIGQPVWDHFPASIDASRMRKNALFQRNP